METRPNYRELEEKCRRLEKELREQNDTIQLERELSHARWLEIQRLYQKINELKHAG